jgi:predicted Fe-Mo cluster-binding NifX family protein
MKVCFAVQQDEGIESRVYNHFGSAPVFIMIDTEEKQVRRIDNKDLHHVHGACNPIMALDGNLVDAVVVGGIGAGAIMGLNARGIKVYRAVAETVKQNMDLIKTGNLPELSVEQACGGHGHHGGCAHD